MEPHAQILDHARALKAWLFDDVLPLWSSVGVDRQNGGFFERIDDGLKPVEEPRRSRLVARQIYVFATAGSMGWDGPWQAMIAHGLAQLEGKILRADYTIIPTLLGDGSVARAEFDLYDTAFALFALAAAAAKIDRQRYADLAHQIRQRFVADHAHPAGGFSEGPDKPLKANPHMHLFEASLAWEETAPDDANWSSFADRIAELCLRRFLDSNGALREFFDRDWRPSPDDAGRILEPGHQFEWAWLLMRWGVKRNRNDAMAAAQRLIDIAEAQGVDRARGVAFNESWDDFSIRDAKARLWPQTERIKAWWLAAQLAKDADARRTALIRTSAGIDGLKKYFAGKPKGLWWDTMNADGSFVPQWAPASTLYHIICAIECLNAPLVTLAE